MKICRRCNKEKSDEEFYKIKKSKDGLDSWCKSCKNKYNRKYSEKWNRNPKNKRKRKKWKNKWYKFHKLYHKEHHLTNSIIVLQVYSDGKMKCEICDEDDIDVLTIDHIDGGGTEHRKNINIGAGSGFKRWLIKNNFPSGYRVLCRNCNWKAFLSRMDKLSEAIR